MRRDTREGAARWGEMAAAFAVLVFFTLLGLKFAEMTLDFYTAGRTTATIEIPTAPFWMMTTSMLWLCIPIQLLVILTHLRDLPRLRTRHD